MIIFRLALVLLALILIFVGVVAMIAPTPFGFIFVILGFLILTAGAPGLVRRLRRRFKWLDRQMDKIRKPRWLAALLRRTDPKEKDRKANEDEEGTDRPPENDS